MMMRSRTLVLLCLLAALMSTPGCLVRRRVISSQSAPGKPRQLLSATREELLRRVRQQYDAINAFNATVDMTPVVGSVYQGKITEYKDIRAYIIYRKPDMIRVIGLYPVVRSKAFDMVSDGTLFRALIPSKNRFIEGRNDAPPNSKNPLENLRPEAFTSALLIPPPKNNEDPLLVDSTDEETALYILVLVGKTPEGRLAITRSIFFDRTTLLIVRQKSYDPNGNIISDTRYRNWKPTNGVLFPYGVDINRPEDGYGVAMNVIKVDINSPITDDKFVLNRPEGTQLQTVGTPAPASGQPR
jgi:outer membrane lipoprotein-sorting protein